MKRTVYILGAGSSISHSGGLYPSILQIFKKAWELEITTDDGENIAPKYIELGKYIETNFTYALSDCNEKLDFEKVFTFVDIDLEKDQKRFWILRQQLLEILDTVFMKLKNKVRSGDGTEYQSFVDAINVQDTIVTFNWDVLLDDCLDRLYWLKVCIEKSQKIKRKMKTDLYHYSHFLRSLVDEEYDYDYIATQIRYGFYLKLHGSVDWHSCQNQNCRQFNKVFPTRNPLKNRKCRECLNFTETILIPPTLKKSIHPVPLIGKQWNIACEELVKSDRIVFWGYGLPATDFNAEWLIRQTRNGKNSKGVFVINISEKDRKKIKHLFDKQANVVGLSEDHDYSEFEPTMKSWKEA